jgi:2',3'-cyclic-nucleotide 2'-phosphodiesterase (5'-nucleotidase family)
VQGFTEDAAAPLVCVTNGGGIRATIEAGPVTFGEVNTVLPFGNTVYVLQLTGATLKATLELAYSGVRAQLLSLHSVIMTHPHVTSIHSHPFIGTAAASDAC